MDEEHDGGGPTGRDPIGASGSFPPDGGRTAGRSEPIAEHAAGDSPPRGRSTPRRAAVRAAIRFPPVRWSLRPDARVRGRAPATPPPPPAAPSRSPDSRNDCRLDCPQGRRNPVRETRRRCGNRATTTVARVGHRSGWRRPSRQRRIELPGNPENFGPSPLSSPFRFATVAVLAGVAPRGGRRAARPSRTSPPSAPESGSPVVALRTPPARRRGRGGGGGGVRVRPSGPRRSGSRNSPGAPAPRGCATTGRRASRLRRTSSRRPTALRRAASVPCGAAPKSPAPADPRRGSFGFGGGSGRRPDRRGIERLRPARESDGPSGCR